MEAKAVQKYLRRSPRKVRLVVDLVRGKKVDFALRELAYLNKGASDDVAKVIKSATANLRDKFEEERFDESELVIKEIFVDEASTLKRIQPAPQGRAHQIRKRSSHITVVVTKEAINETEEA